VAETIRAAEAPILLSGIAAAVNPRVVPLWSQYLFGGSAPQDLSSKFAGDFMVDSTTTAATAFLIAALQTDLQTSPPVFPAGSTTTVVPLASRIAPAIAELGDPGSANRMNFSTIGSIPGNIAGDIGKTQTTCPVGALSSPFDDDRSADGNAVVVQNPDGSLLVVPSITFTVKDTIDLCPGNCGAPKEQIATVPMSRMEATGISGDVPFTVTYPSLPQAPFTVIPITPPPAPAPPSPAPAPGALTGEVTASALRIRVGPGTSSAVVGSYPRGTVITILCQTTGTVVEGNSTWDKTDQGFVSDRYINRIGGGTPPNC
jgi:hypothetical protein